MSPSTGDDNLATLTVPTSSQLTLDNTFLTPSPNVDDDDNLNVLSELSVVDHTSELTDLPHSSEEHGSESSTQSILDIAIRLAHLLNLMPP